MDSIEGLSPTISIEQRSGGRNPRSTVGTQTEIHDYLRVFFARAGIQHCPKCGKIISGQSSQQIVDRIVALPEGTKFLILSPLVTGRKGEHIDIMNNIPKKSPFNQSSVAQIAPFPLKGQDLSSIPDPSKKGESP